MFGWKPGIVYAYSCKDHHSAKRIWWAYVGQTRQELVARHNQHMGHDTRQPAQPWSDLYPEIRVVFHFKYCPNWFLDLAEELVIKFTMPKYNYIHNTKNPGRIPKFRAIAERKERDLRRRKRAARLVP